MTKITPRKEALARGLKRYFSGNPCPHGHVAERWINGECVECVRERSREYYAANRAKLQERSREWAKKYRERERKRYAANREKNRERVRKWRAENPEKYRNLKEKERKRRGEN